MNLSLRGARRSFFRILLAGLWLGLGGGLAGSLAGCGGAVGSGNGPSRMVISAPSQIAPLPALRMYECLTSGLRALLYFQDGSVGDFTNRVTWSSSNPGAVQVSNGDVAGPGGFYARGVLVPTGQGNAIVTANYFGIIGQTAVSVGTPRSMTLKSVINGNYMPLTSINPNNPTGATTFSMGQGTQQQLAVTALLDNVETDVSKFATFGFKDPNPAVAVFAGTGVLVAGRDGGPLVPQASFAPCSLTTISDPNNIVEMRVTQVQGIAMQPEFPPPDPSQPISDSNPLPQLIVGNSERFKVIATLHDGNQQDVSSQSTLTVSGNTSGATFGGLSGVNNLLFATAAGGPLILNATFNVANAGLNSPTIVTSAVNQVLQSFTVCATDLDTIVTSCPASQPVPTVSAGSLTPLQFHAIGYYGVDSNNQPITQDITRVVSWTSSNNAIAIASSSGNAAGQVHGVQQGSTIIEAQDTAAIAIPQVFTQVIVNPPP
jgi:hypothetical protein